MSDASRVSKLELWDLALEDLRGAVFAWGVASSTEARRAAHEQVTPLCEGSTSEVLEGQGPELKLRDLLPKLSSQLYR